MPIIKSAKKRVKLTRKRTVRLLPYRTRMKTLTKRVLVLAKEEKKAEAEKALPEAYAAIDIAVKKNILHKNTGARRKSSISRAVAAIGAK